METKIQSSVFSNMQQELLKLYAKNISDKQLIEIKRLLANYFAEQATEAMDKLWDKQGFNDQTMIDWTHEHNRKASS